MRHMTTFQSISTAHWLVSNYTASSLVAEVCLNNLLHAAALHNSWTHNLSTASAKPHQCATSSYSQPHKRLLLLRLLLLSHKSIPFYKQIGYVHKLTPIQNDPCIVRLFTNHLRANHSPFINPNVIRSDVVKVIGVWSEQNMWQRRHTHLFSFYLPKYDMEESRSVIIWGDANW